MKITNYVLVFAILLTSVITVVFVRTQQLHTLVQRQTYYNEVLDNAIQSGLASAVQADDGSLHINYQIVTNTFFNSVYAGFGISDNIDAQKQISAYVPVIAVMDVDGFYIRYIVNEIGPEERWTNKIPYTYEPDSKIMVGGVEYAYTINFRLDDKVQINVIGGSTFEAEKDHMFEVYDESTNSDFSVLRAIWDTTFLSGTMGDQHYYSFRAYCVGQTVARYLNYYVDKYNEIAKDFGISYKFTVPNTAASDISRSLEDIMFVCIFQGYPYGTGTVDTYSKFTVSGARVRKSGVYYTRQADNGITYYHNGYCQHDGKAGQGKIFYSKRQAAENDGDGAYPCPFCNP